MIFSVEPLVLFVVIFVISLYIPLIYSKEGRFHSDLLLVFCVSEYSVLWWRTCCLIVLQ